MLSESELESGSDSDGEGSSGSKADLYSISGVTVKRREVSALGVVAKCGDSNRVNLQRASVGGGVVCSGCWCSAIGSKKVFLRRGCTSTRRVKGWVSSQRTACAVSEM